MEVVPRFFNDPGQSYFLFGPRGTGKSLWVRQMYPQALWVDLLDPESFRLYTSRPERLRELVQGNPGRRPMVIDEVQKAPDLLNVVHSLIDEHKGLDFVLTGSSARKLRRSGVDLLSGRALVKTLHPFMAAELGTKFHLDRALKHGLLPLVVAATRPSQTIRAYHALYLREEVQMEGLVRNVGNFGRFLETISFSHASVLNLSNVARECAVQRKTVEGFVTILEDLLLAFRVPVFTRRAKRATAARPKFYLFDCGVFRSLRPQGPLDRAAEIDGVALEGLVMQHLRAWNAYRGARNALYYWRTRSGVEVDMVVYGEDGFWAIEVKNSARVDRQDVRGLRTFVHDYPQCRPLLLYRGSERLKLAGVQCTPCAEFLERLHPHVGQLPT